MTRAFSARLSILARSRRLGMTCRGLVEQCTAFHPGITSMGRPHSTLYTRTGDAGDTGLANGSRLDKDARRIACIGDLDELNSALGVVLAQCPDADLGQLLTRVQHRLFDLGGELAMPGSVSIQALQVTELEHALDRLDAELPRLKAFILPGGSPAAAYCHMARGICRRAERQLITLARQELVNPHSRRYLNRLSDLLFVAARILNHRAGKNDVLWNPLSAA
jgi:cob(I)alamin adenosyltransferase